MNKLLLLLLPLLLLGCGAEPSRDPQRSADIYMDSLLGGNWSDVCALLDEPSRASLGQDCEQGAEQVFGRIREIYEKSDPRIIFKERRWAAAATDAVPRVIYLYRQGGLWQVTLFPPESLQRSLE